MPATIETTVYTFDELSDTAKERARDWFREGIGEDTFWSEAVIEDAEMIANALGITFNQRAVPLHSGGKRYEPAVYWQLHSQGAGACFEGLYAYKRGGVKAVKEEYPTDTELHRIAEGLQKVQRRNFYGILAAISNAYNGVHSGCTRFDFQHSLDTGNRSYPISDSDCDTVKELLRAFMDWIYKALDAEYDYRTSDDCVDEDIRANEYTFTENGERFG